MTDLYPDEEGYICDGNVVAFCKCAGSVPLHSGVKFGSTAVSGAISVLAGAADGDSNGISLKAGNTNDYIPVCFFGVVKMIAGDTIAEQDFLKSDASATYILPLDTFTHDQFSLWRGLVGATTGSIWRLGMALQAGAASGDEFLMLVGRIA